MQKRKSAFLSGTILCIAVAIAISFYFISRPHTNVEGIKPNETVSAESLYSQYESNEPMADKKYLNKVIEVKGGVTTSGHSNQHYFIILKTKSPGGINCEMMMKDTTMLLKMQKERVIIIKGRCIGFLMDVNLVDCVISK